MSQLVAGEATVEVTPSFKGFVTESSKEATKAGNAAATSFNRSMASGVEQPGKFKAMGASMASHVGGAFKVGLGAAGVAGAGLVGTALTKGFQRLTAIDDARAKLTGLGNSAQDVDSIMKNAMASVKGTAFGMGEAATTAAGSVAAGVKPGKDLERTLRLTADAATIAGTDMGSMGAIFNKVATSNKIQGDTIAQLSDAGIPVVQMLSKELGKSSEEVVALASKGKINFAQFQNAMEQGLGGAAQSSGKTFSGAMKNFQASLGRIGANLMGGIFPKLAPGLTQITKAMEPLEAKAKLVGNAIGDWVSKGVAKLPGMIEQVKLFGSGISNAFKTGDAIDDGFLGKIEGVIGSVKALKDLMIGGDYTGGLRTYFGWEEDSKEVDKLLTIRDKAVGVVNTIKAKFSDASTGGAGGGLASMFDSLANAGQKFISNFKPEQITNIFSSLGSLAPVANSGLQVFGVVLGTVANHADLVAKALPLLIAAWAAHRLMMQANVAVGRQSVIGFWAQTAATTANAVATLANRGALAASAASNRVLAISQYATANGMSASTAAQELNTAATNQSIFASIRQRVATAASTAAQYAASAASRVMAAGQWLLNAAMNANPISLVVLALVALGAAFVIAWNKSETFRGIVTGAWNGIKDAALGVWNWMKSVLWPGLAGVWNGLSNTFVGVKDSIVGTWNKITGKFTEAWNWASGVFKSWWGGIVTILSWPVDSAKGWIVKHWDGITGKFTAVKNWVFGGFKAGWSGVVTLLSWPIDSAKGWIVKHWDGIVSKFTSVKNWVFGEFKRAWDGLKTLITDPVQAGKNMLDNILGKDDNGGIRGMFNTAVKAVGKIWDKLKSIVTSPINGVIGIINNPFISGFNKLGSKFGLTLPTLPTIGGKADGGLVGRAGGGTIPGPYRGARRDNVLGVSDKGVPVARVNPREYITRVWATRRMERNNPGALAHINRYGELPSHADGGWAGMPHANTGAGHTKPGKYESYRPSVSIVELGRYLQSKGYQVGQHPAFGGVARVHMGTSLHYAGQALDVNHDQGNEDAALSSLATALVKEGWGTIWHSAGHYDHLHVDTGIYSKLGGKLTKISKTNGFVDALKSGVGFIASTIFNPLKAGAFKLIDGVAGKFGGGEFATKLIAGVAKKAVEGAIGWGNDGSGSDSANMETGVSGSKAAAAWKPQIIEALKLNGITPTPDLINRWITQIGWESSGNPNAVQGNIGDINNKTGDLAKGLVQVIGSTFRAYHVSGTPNNVFDPIANLAAGINYAKHTYGSNMSYIGRGPKHGYNLGGMVAPIHTRRVRHYAQGGRTRPGLAVVGEYGPEVVNMRGTERVVTNSQLGGDSMSFHYHSDGSDTNQFASDVIYQMRRVENAGRYRD